MTPERALWIACAAVFLIALIGYCTQATPRPDGLLPTLTPTLAVTVLPTATGVLEAELRPTKTPQPPIILDALPMATATVRPSDTATPSPTATAVPPTPARPPVQRG